MKRERENSENEEAEEKDLKKYRHIDEEELYKKLDQALVKACEDGNADVVEILLENDAYVSASDKAGSTAIICAAKNGHVDVMKVLIQKGADVNAVDNWKRTALHLAAQNGHVDLAKVLIQNGVDLNAVGEIWGTALQTSAHHEKVACTLQLLCFGAEIDEYAIKFDMRLRPIESRLKLLRSGNRMGTSLMSDEEKRFMWNLAYVLTIKYPAIAFGTYQRIRSFVTFHGIFMGPGYDLGGESIWRRKR